MMGTFIDTIIVCTLTATAITVSGAYTESTFMAGDGGLGGIDLTIHAFNTGMPGFLSSWGGTIVVFSSLVFGFTTLIGWSYYGQIIFREKPGKRQTLRWMAMEEKLLFNEQTNHPGVFIDVGNFVTFGFGPVFEHLGEILFLVQNQLQDSIFPDTSECLGCQFVSIEKRKPADI